jgi:hypothetical protein
MLTYVDGDDTWRDNFITVSKNTMFVDIAMKKSLGFRGNFHG